MTVCFLPVLTGVCPSWTQCDGLMLSQKQWSLDKCFKRHSHTIYVFHLFVSPSFRPFCDVSSHSGLIQNWVTPGSLFCLLQMKVGKIVYMHDSTESTEDSFTLSASAYEIGRRSLPITISVTVIPVNDEPPKLTRNTGLEVMFALWMCIC